MSVQRTLSIIKPNAVKSNNIGSIICMLENAGLKLIAAKLLTLETEQAESFYKAHKNKPFYAELVKFMTSGPIVVMALEGQNAIMSNRKVMGATDPDEAAPNTIRAKYADSITENAVHGSDGEESADEEIRFFFG